MEWKRRTSGQGEHMPEALYRSEMPVCAEALMAWHARPGARERLIVPEGSLQFTGSLATWRHRQECVPLTATTSLLEDHIVYRLPGRGLGQAVAGRAIGQTLDRIFQYRHARLEVDLQRHAAFRPPTPWRIAITGATGMVGAPLCHFLESGGHRVDRLVRRPPAPGSTDIQWDPASGGAGIAPDALEGVDAVIHLAGENVGGGRWTPARMQAIMDSRRHGTMVLAEALARLKHKPAVLISASGVGYYGDHGDEVLTEEDTEAGRGFLAEVCQAWELATAPASQAGIRVANLRIGAVLAPSGGALAKLLPPFRCGLGGVVGSGRQWMSWIGLDDLLGVIHHVLATDLAGPINATAPQPVTNLEFTRALARVLHRPSVFPLPAAVVQIAFGQMGHELLLEGARVVPGTLLEHGYRFHTPYLEEALRWELGMLAVESGARSGRGGTST